MAASERQPSFGEVLRSLLEDREEFLTQTRNINWRLVADELEGVHYETLRKAVAGDRPPTPHLMEQAAELAGVEPTVFGEYRLHQAQAQFDVKEVGWQQAMDNLRAWSDLHTKKKH